MRQEKVNVGHFSPRMDVSRQFEFIMSFICMHKAVLYVNIIRDENS